MCGPRQVSPPLPPLLLVQQAQMLPVLPLGPTVTFSVSLWWKLFLRARGKAPGSCRGHFSVVFFNLSCDYT